jgi:hypothetical protein
VNLWKAYIQNSSKHLAKAIYNDNSKSFNADCCWEFEADDAHKSMNCLGALACTIPARLYKTVVATVILLKIGIITRLVQGYDSITATRRVINGKGGSRNGSDVRIRGCAVDAESQ